MQRRFVIASLASLAGLAAAPAASAAGPTPGTLRIGFNPGPYKEEFQGGVAPQLQKKGYRIEYIDFSDGIQVNNALATGLIEANIMQHPVYLKSINERLGIDNAALVQVPTAPMGLYSDKHGRTPRPPVGATVSVPNQAPNEYRALLLLQALGWLRVAPESDPATFSRRNVTENPYRLKIVEMDNAQQVRALPDVDYGAIQGNFAVAAGLKLTSAIQLEKASVPFTSVVAIAGRNRDVQFARDIAEGFRSREFQAYIRSHHQYDGYMLPTYFTD